MFSCIVYSFLAPHKSTNKVLSAPVLPPEPAVNMTLSTPSKALEKSSSKSWTTTLSAPSSFKSLTCSSLRTSATEECSVSLIAK